MTIAKKSNIAGQISFIQNHIPPFDAGTYRLVLSQSVTVIGNPKLERSFQFAVTGERFRFKPSELGTVFPPADSTGEYDNVLPHVVLTRKSLPWERTATGGAPQESANHDVAPWIGLLLFSEVEMPSIQTVTVGDLFDKTDFDKSQLPPSVFSAFSRRPPDLPAPRPPKTELGYHETTADLCRVIDIPLATFNRIAPAKDDLHWLAHARKLTMPLPQKAPTTDPPQTISSDFAAVFGNRLPQVGENNTAVLVSLEGIANYLPDAAGQPAADTHKQVAQQKTALRLVVLHSWSFKVSPAQQKNHQSFAQLIANLNGRDPNQSLLRWTQPTDNVDVDRAFALGYTALPHQTRQGDQTISWYRGPFVPYPVQKTLSLPIMSADGATFYDQEMGMFDVAYAAAWQLGRLLALNNKAFATDLYTWKRVVRQRTHDSMVQKHLRAMAPQEVNADEEAHKRTLVQTILTSSLRNALDHKQFKAESVPPRSDRHDQKMQAVTDTVELEKLNDRPPVPPSLTKWLGRLLLLHGVPFNYLVPDQRLLPPESLRFFRLDANWMASLIDGANALGRIGSADAHDQVFADYLFEQACAAANMQSLDQVSGFLLCSALVDGWWPGLKIDGYSKAEDHPEADCRLPILRQEQLAPNVLLCLFDGIVKRLDFHPPPEGLHFGLTVLQRDDNGTPVVFEKELRNLVTGKEIIVTGKDDQDGPTADTAKAVHEIPFRGERVLQVTLLADVLSDQLGNPARFTSAEFAMQMIEGTQMGGFIHVGEVTQ